MTIKQCNSCKYHIYVKELGDCCGLYCREFMKPKDCRNYDFGELNEDHKDFFKKMGKPYPFTEMR